MSHFLFHTPDIHSTNQLDNRILKWSIIILTIVKLWLVEAQDLVAIYQPHDEYLFVRLAQHILRGEWLGPYNQLTLIKGPVYPLFIAFAHHTGLPLLFVQHLVYTFSCILSILAIKPFIKHRWILIFTFFFLLYNPFTYAYPVAARAFRFGLSVPLILALFGSICGLLLRTDFGYRKLLMWSTGIGIIFSLLWFTREEGIWLLPPLLFFGIYFVVINSKINFNSIAKRFMLLAWICTIFIGFKGTFTYLNMKHYGAPHVVEIKSSEFQAALGGLMSINGKNSRRRVPVSKESQEIAYQVSPTFKQLEPYFRKAPKRWPKFFYIWTLRDMVAQSGNADNLPEALYFYGKIGEEIATACNAGVIDCIDRKPSITPIWKNEYIKIFPSMFWQTFSQAVTFSMFSSDDHGYTKAPKALSWFPNNRGKNAFPFVTREKLVPNNKADVKNYPDYYMHMIIEKFRILTDIGNSYKAVIGYFFWTAVLAHLLLAARCVKMRSIYFDVVFGIIILSGVISLISMLTFVKMTLWPIGRPLFSAYPLVLLYISIMFIFSSNYLISLRKNVNPI